MKRRRRRVCKWDVIHTAIALVFGVNLVGVAVMFLVPAHEDLLEDGTLGLELAPATDTYLPHAHARPEGGVLLVSGRLKRKPDFAGSVTGKLEVSLVSPDGVCLDRVATRYILSNGTIASTVPNGIVTATHGHKLKPWGDQK